MPPYPSKQNRLSILIALCATTMVIGATNAQTPGREPQTAGEAAKAIGDNPYARKGTQNCQAIAGAVAELDAALGPDFDEPRPSGPSADAKAISTARDVALGFIPGRGLIREVSGANKAEQRYAHAVYAGMTRRAFLKGIGAQRGCKAPAAPATKG